MQFTVKKGVRYGAKVHLSGFETMASDEQIIEILEDAGFKDVTVKDLDDETKIVYGVWAREDKTEDMPSQIVYVEEAPL